MTTSVFKLFPELNKKIQEKISILSVPHYPTPKEIEELITFVAQKNIIITNGECSFVTQRFNIFFSFYIPAKILFSKKAPLSLQQKKRWSSHANLLINEYRLAVIVEHMSHFNISGNPTHNKLVNIFFRIAKLEPRVLRCGIGDNLIINEALLMHHLYILAQE